MVADEPYTVVVALDDPESVDQLVRTAADVARQHDGRIHAVTVEHRPVSSPFLLFSDESVRAQFAGEKSAVLEAAVEATDVPVTTEFLVGSSVSDVLREVVDREGAGMLLVGWYDRPRPADIVLGTTVDSLVRRPPCDLLVERIGTTVRELERVLVPTVGEPHLSCIATVGEAIARENDVPVSLLSVIPGSPSREERAEGERILDRAADALSDARVEGLLVEATRSERGILDTAEPSDVIVMGATGTGLIRPPVIGSVARAVGTDAPCPVIIGKQASGSRLQGLLSRL